MSNLNRSILLQLKSNIERRSQRDARALNKMASSSNRSMGKMRRGFDKTEARHKRMAGKMASNASRYGKVMAAGIIAGAAVAIKKIGELDERVSRLLVSGNIRNKGHEELFAKRDEIKAAIYEQKIKLGIDDKELYSALEAAVLKTGILETALENLPNMALVLSGTGSGGDAIGKTFAELQKIGLTEPKKVLSFFEATTAQGKEGAFTTDMFSKYSGKLFGAGAPANNEHDVRIINAVMQTIMRTKDNDSESVGSFKALMAAFQNKEIIDQLAKLKDDKGQWSGIDVYKKDKSGKHKKDDLGNKVLRDLHKLMVEIVKKSDGNMAKLGTIFKDMMVKDAFADLSKMRRDGKDIDKFMSDLVHAKGDGQIQRDSDFMEKSQGSVRRKMSGAIESVLDKQLSGLTQSMNSFISDMDSKVVTGLVYAAQALVLAAAALGARNLIRGGKGGKGTKVPRSQKPIPKPKPSGALRGYGAPKPVVKPSLIDKMSAGKSTVQGAQKPNVPKPNVPKPNVPKPNVPKPNVPKPNVPKPSSIGKVSAGKLAAKGAARFIPGIGWVLLGVDVASEIAEQRKEYKGFKDGGFKTTTQDDYQVDYDKGLAQVNTQQTDQQWLKQAQQHTQLLQASKQVEMNMLESGLKQMIVSGKANAAHTATSMIQQFHKNPGRIDINVKASAGASATVSGVTNPTGQKLKIHNTVDSMRVGP